MWCLLVRGPAGRCLIESGLCALTAVEACLVAGHENPPFLGSRATWRNTGTDGLFPVVKGEHMKWPPRGLRMFRLRRLNYVRVRKIGGDLVKPVLSLRLCLVEGGFLSRNREQR